MKKILKNAILILLFALAPVYVSAHSVVYDDPILQSAYDLLITAQNLNVEPEQEEIVQDIIARVQQIIAEYISSRNVEIKNFQDLADVFAANISEGEQVFGESDMEQFNSLHDDVDNLIALYRVFDDGPILIYGESYQAHAVYWGVAEIVMDESITDDFIGYFAVYRDDETDVAAYVESSSLSDEWLLAFNDSQIESREITMVSVAEIFAHEMAHVATLNVDQVQFGIRESLCKTDYTYEGCPNSESYYQLFINEFWDKQGLAYINSLQDLSSEDIYQEVESWYLPRKSNFVTQYAATHPAEDIAESFSHFLLQDLIGEYYQYGDVALQKINFFSHFPEFLELKNNFNTEWSHLFQKNSTA